MMVEPCTVLTHPTSTHIPASVKTIDRVTNPHRHTSRVRTIRIAIPPADRITDPRPTLRRGRRCRIVRGSRGRNRRRIHTRNRVWRRLRCRSRNRIHSRLGRRSRSTAHRQVRRSHQVRGVTRVNAQVNICHGWRHRHIHRGSIRILTLRHVGPVLKDRLSAVRTDLHDAHLSSARNTARHGSCHGRRRARRWPHGVVCPRLGNT